MVCRLDVRQRRRTTRPDTSVAKLFHLNCCLGRHARVCRRVGRGILYKVVLSVGTGKFTVTLLIGAPGAGKGTQSRFVRDALGIPHIATGDLLRDHRRRGTKLGRTARAYMDRGDLVPDDLVVHMVVERMEQPDAANGVLLDGFPRTQAQADALDAELRGRGGGVIAALYLDVEPSVLVRRLSGRRICGKCGGTFHIDMPDLPADGTCPDCGRRLVQRRDDHRAAVAQRLSVFLDQTAAVVEHYRSRRLVHRVRGDQPVEAIKNELLAVLQRKRPTLVAS
jgi:adenylate kinase